MIHIYLSILQDRKNIGSEVKQPGCRVARFRENKNTRYLAKFELKITTIF